MLNAAGISFNDQWYSSQYLQFKIEMHFSSHYCYMFSSDQVYVTSQTKRYLTSIDRLCLHVTHSFALIYPFSPWVSRSVFSLSSLQLWMFVQMEWNHQDEKISLRSLPSILVGFSAPPFHSIPFSVTLFLSFWSASPSLLQPNTGVWRPKVWNYKDSVRFKV